MERTLWERLKQLGSRAYREFIDDKCFVLAGSVAYFGLFSFFPLALLTLAAVGRVLGSEDKAAGALIEFFGDYLPGGLATAQSMVGSLVDSHGLLNWLAMLGLLWAGSQILYYLEIAMNLAWDCAPRPWWQSRMRSVLFLLMAQGLAAAHFLLSIASLARRLIGKLPGYEWLNSDQLLEFSLWFVSFGLSLLVFVMLNRFLPNCTVSWKAGLFGGLVSAGLMEVARFGFRHYLENFANYNLLYGSIGGLFVLVMWAYYAALITLLGAELASEVEETVFGIPRCNRRHAPEGVDEQLRNMGIEAEFS